LRRNRLAFIGISNADGRNSLHIFFSAEKEEPEEQTEQNNDQSDNQNDYQGCSFLIIILFGRELFVETPRRGFRFFQFKIGDICRRFIVIKGFK
jgi:hypothetical protein